MILEYLKKEEVKEILNTYITEYYAMKVTTVENMV